MLNKLTLFLSFPCERTVLYQLFCAFLVLNEKLCEFFESERDVFVEAIELKAAPVDEFKYY